MSWVNTATLASIAAISDRGVRKALSAIASGELSSWRGYFLNVRKITGCGGAAGVSYVVEDTSLPPELQQRLKTLQSPVEGRSNVLSGNDAARERSWWLHVLGPALELPKGSQERKSALAEAASTTQLDWHGRRWKPSMRTLQRKLERMEGEGSIRPLARYGRADKGKKRTFISREWDGLVSFDDETKAKLAEDLRQQIRGYLKQGTQPKELNVLASAYLVRITRQWGFRPAENAPLERACRIPRHLIEAESQYRKLYRHKYDRKASEDDRPRVKRTKRGLRPMEIVVMDVHPIDVLVARPDGLTATAKLLGFLDLATGRLWAELIFFDKRGGVRNRDVVEAFIAMATDPSFGLPETIYIDNGSEYRFADFLGDALKLAVPYLTPDGKRGSRVIRALPYNAAAKPIERLFGHLEQHFLRHAKGWIGGDRVNKKQQEIGKAVAPFGSFETFKPYFFGLLQAYQAMPHTHGEHKGRSPNDIFKEHVDAGWAATVINPESLHMVFTKPETRMVRNHSISVDGRIWTGPALDSYFGSSVTVHIPAYHGFNELLIVGEKGEELGIVKPHEELEYFDERGAKSSASRVKEKNKALRAMDRSTPNIDVGKELIAYGKANLPVQPNEPLGTVSVMDGAPSRQLPKQVEVKAVKTEADRRREAEEIYQIQQNFKVG
ncbi:MAG: transposase family protein [Rhizobiaceae bacterium]|nr:transposase family protein [Rhizobiaceae bacterium]